MSRAETLALIALAVTALSIPMSIAGLALAVCAARRQRQDDEAAEAAIRALVSGSNGDRPESSQRDGGIRP